MDLESIIRKYVPLKQHPSQKGWYPVICKVCGDHGGKGERAAFKFENGNVGYNCFNDSHCNASYASTQTDPLSKGMHKLLQAYHIPESEYEWIDVEALQRKDNGEVLVSADRKHIKTIPDPIEMPRFFKKLSDVDEDNQWRLIAEDYLIEQRHIDPSTYPFYLSFEDEVFPHWKKWYGRLIIPFYDNNGNLIFYQGRSLTKSPVKKYLNPYDDRDIVMFGYDEIYRRTDDPLYIVEGFFDAFHIGGVAVIGNKLTEGMLFHLNRSSRPKIIIPDKFGDGYKLALQGLHEGWSISTPEIGSCCKDISDAVVRFGKLYTLASIAEHTYTDFSAEVHLKLFCDDYK